MARVWKMVHSLFIGEAPRRMTAASRVPVVALVVNEQDRHVLASVFGEEPLDVRFAESCEEAYSVTNQLTAPVILLDRDWPGTEWKAAVERLASSQHRPCVILVSRISDTYLSQELADKVERTVRLALSYWNNAAKSAVRVEDPRK